ncbi:MAG: methanethiol S-methyltransferase [Vicinamibacterales bacterium]
MATRVLYLIYGVVAYLWFLATFLYAIAFVGGFGVPRTLDATPTVPFLTGLLVDAGLLTVFAVQHSVMARRWFKRWWTQTVPWAIERSTYVLFASLALNLLYWQWQPLGGVVWHVEPPVARGLLWALFAAGWLQVLVMTFYINHFDLFGLRQVWLHAMGRHYTHVHFATPAPYRVVRHPLYLGFIIAFWAAPTMTVTHLVFALATTAYIVVAIQFEERDLAHEHGASYLSYRRAVPMLIPGTGSRSTAPVGAERS